MSMRTPPAHMKFGTGWLSIFRFSIEAGDEQANRSGAYLVTCRSNAAASCLKKAL